MSKIAICLLLPVFLFSCYSVDKAPDDILKPAKMQSLLWDMMRAQTLAQETSLKDTSLNAPAEVRVLTKEIFQLHHTDSAEFTKSYNWYVKHPASLKLIFDSLYVQKQRQGDTRLKKKEKILRLPQ